MGQLINEIYQIAFASSTLYIIGFLFFFSMKTYGRFYLKDETIKLTIKRNDKIYLLLSISIFISYLF